MNYLLSLVAFLTSFIFAMVIIPWILSVAYKYFLYDIPDERKMHSKPVPRLGGISFFHCIIFSVLFTYVIFHLFAGTTDRYSASSCFFLCALLLVYVGGLKDDMIGMRTHYKLLLQFAAALLVVFSGVYINHFYGLFGIEAIAPWIGMPLSVLAIIFIINAMNLIDGIDGLSSGISMIALLVYGVLFLMHDVWYYAVLAFSTIGVLCVFFYYNVFGSIKKKRKLFMGDSGSMMLGLILSFLAIQYMHDVPDFIKPADNVLVVALTPLLIPALDVLRVILLRLRRHKNIFSADCCHIHHKMLDVGLSQSMALIFLLGLTAGFCMINFTLMLFLNTLTIFMIDLVLWTVGNIYLSHLIHKKQP